MPPRPRRGPITSIPWGCGQVVHPRAGHVCTIRFSVHLQTQPFWSLRHQPSRAKAAAAGHTATKREQAMSHDVPVLQCPRSRPWHRRWQAPESPDQDNEFKQQATKGRTEPQVPKGSRSRAGVDCSRCFSDLQRPGTKKDERRKAAAYTEVTKIQGPGQRHQQSCLDLRKQHDTQSSRRQHMQRHGQ